MADIESLMATIKRRMANIPSPMANIRLLMANIEILMAEITSRHGEKYSGMAKNSLGSITYGGNYPKRDAWLPGVSWRRLLFWLLFLLRLLLPLAACQAQSEPTAQPRVVLYDAARLLNIGSTVGLTR